MDTQTQIIKTIGEKGEEIYMKLQEIVTIDKQDYALMSIVEDDVLPNSDNDEAEIVIMKMNKQDDECTFEIIEDDEEFNLVASAISDEEE